MRRKALKENYLVTICGPTGIGKTDWAIRLAQHYQTEILSGDSRQFYREMKIGTAVPSEKELQMAPHHFIQHKSILESYSVGDFQKETLLKLNDIFKSHHLAILVGGSGLFMDAITKGLDQFPEAKPETREELSKIHQTKGIHALRELLAIHDPEYYRQVDLNNPRRLIRALEVCLTGGKPYSSFRGKKRAPDLFRHIPLGIKAPREHVYRRIEQRADLMMEKGLLKEAENLYAFRDRNALQTVGYQELFAYLEGKCDLATAVAEIKKNTRRFAKRQETWFGKNPEICWLLFDADVKTAIEQIEMRIKALEDEA